GGNFATNAIAGGVVIPGSSAVNMGTGLGGYVQNNSPGTSFGVGGFGICNPLVTGAKCEGGNFVAVSHAPGPAEVVGAEFDVKNAFAGDTIEGIQLNSIFNPQPSAAYAIFVANPGIAGSNANHWTQGLFFDIAATSGTLDATHGAV